MKWLLWRQHRMQVLVAICLFIPYAYFVIHTGHYNQHAGRSPNYFVNETWINIVRASIAVPFLFAMFIGAPLLSSEYAESRSTNKFVWTQGISRTRWLCAKLVWAILFAAVFGLGCSLLASWWIHTTSVDYPLNRFDFMQFNISGFMPVAYAVFGVTLGAMLGAWLRKPILALGVTLVVLTGIQLGIGYGLRPHYMRPITAPTSDVPSSQTLFVWQAPFVCTTAHSSSGDSQMCYSPKTSYQPASRYWDFQGIEAALYTCLTVGSLAVIYVLITKRDA